MSDTSPPGGIGVFNTMATPASAGDIFEVVQHARQEGQEVLNVMYFRCATAVDDIEVRLLRALIICLTTQLVPTMGSNYQFVKMSCKRVTPTLGPIIEVGPEAGDNLQGDAEGDTLPSHCSICVNIHTTRGGRSGRGRMFLAGIPEGASSGSFIETTNPHWAAILAYLACVASQFVKPTVDVGSNIIQLGVMSRKLAAVNKPPFPAGAFAPATKLVPRNQIGSSNSRKVGKGS
jgi:hypothetical protein